MDNAPQEQPYPVLFAIWIGLTGGVAVLAGVTWALASGLLGEEPMAAALPPTVALGGLAAGVLLMVAGIVMRRSTSGARGEAAPAGAFSRRSIVAWAVQEAGGFLGVVTSMLAGRPSWILVAGGLGVFSMLLTRPDRREVQGSGRGR